MSLRKLFGGGRRSAVQSAEASGVADADMQSGMTPPGMTEFAPRADGEYYYPERALYLRFARPIVTETDEDQQELATGEFTIAGRFAVQRPFGRPIVYTVLALTSAPDNGDTADTLTVRRTDTGAKTSEELTFTFRTDR